MKPLVKVFINYSFQSFTIFSFVKTKKEFGEYGPWITKVAFPNVLYYKLNFNSSKAIAIKNYKNSLFRKILDQYKQSNNQEKAQIRQCIQYTFHKALEY